MNLVHLVNWGILVQQGLFRSCRRSTEQHHSSSQILPIIPLAMQSIPGVCADLNSIFTAASGRVNIEDREFFEHLKNNV